MNRWVAGILMVVLVAGTSVPAWAHEGTRGPWTVRQHAPNLATWYVDITASDAQELQEILERMAQGGGSAAGVAALVEMGIVPSIGAAAAIMQLSALGVRMCSDSGQHPIRVYGVALRSYGLQLADGWDEDGVLDRHEVHYGWSSWRYLYAWCSRHE